MSNSYQLPDFKPLSDQLEQTIRLRVDAKIAAAMKAARATCAQAYSEAFRGVCGRAVDIAVTDALSEAEHRITEAARAYALRRELETLVDRLTNEPKEVA